MSMEDLAEALGEIEQPTDGGVPNPQTPDGSAAVLAATAAPEDDTACTPIRSGSTVHSKRKTTKSRRGGGLTMYERSKAQMEERERKLKALQEQLMSDYTFIPQSHSSHQSVGSSSLGGGSSSAATDRGRVFERLYTTDTAATRSWRTRRSSSSPIRSRMHVRTTKDGYVTPSRLEALHAEGQTRQRARRMTQKEEDEARRKRLEDEELAKCTFAPITKWKLAAERRKLQRKERERTAEEAPKRAPKLSERDKRQILEDEAELKRCTFKPKMKWNIIKERRLLASGAHLVWDDYEDDDEDNVRPTIPREIARTPKHPYRGPGGRTVSPLADPEFTPKTLAQAQSTAADTPKPEPVVNTLATETVVAPTSNGTATLQMPKSPMRSIPGPPSVPPSETKVDYADTKIKLVSSDMFQEESGKVTATPSVVRSHYVGAVTPSTPEWKRKYKQIGAKKAEAVLEASGAAASNTQQLRSNFHSPIVAGGGTLSGGLKSPKRPGETTPKSLAVPTPTKPSGGGDTSSTAASLDVPSLGHTTTSGTGALSVAETEMVPSKTPDVKQKETLDAQAQETLDDLLQEEPSPDVSKPQLPDENEEEQITAPVTANNELKESSSSVPMPTEETTAKDEKLSAPEADSSTPVSSSTNGINASNDPPAHRAENILEEKQESAPPVETETSEDKSKGQKTWLGGLLGKREVKDESSQSKEIVTEDVAPTVEKELATPTAAGTDKKEETEQPRSQSSDKKKGKASTWKERLLGKRSAKQNKETPGEEQAVAVERKEPDVAAEQARIKAEKEAAEQARIESEKKAAEEARIKAEQEAAAEKARVEAELKAAEEARIKAEQEAAEQARIEAEKKAAEEARIKAEQEAAEQARIEAEKKAAEEARITAEQEAAEQARIEAEKKAAEEARIKAEQEAAAEKARVEAELKAAEEARIKAEQEAAELARIEAEKKAAEEARAKAEQEAAELARIEAEKKAAEEARIKAEQEAAELARIEAEKKAAEEARIKAEQEAAELARIEAEKKAAEEARIEAELKAAEEARLKAEAAEQARMEAELKAAEEARLKAEQEAAAEQARIEAELKAAEEARIKAEQEAAAEQARIEVELKAAEEARIKAEQEAAAEQARIEAELKAAEAARLKAEEEAIAKSAQLEADNQAASVSEIEAEHEAALEAVRVRAEQKAVETAKMKAGHKALAEEAARAKAALVEKARLRSEKEEAAQLRADLEAAERRRIQGEEALRRQEEQEEAARVEAEQAKIAKMKAEEEKIARIQAEIAAANAKVADANSAPVTVEESKTSQEAGGSEAGKEKKKSSKASKWRERLARRTKSPKRSGSTDEDDVKSDAATAGGAGTEKAAYPRVLLDESEDANHHKEPEIGSI